MENETLPLPSPSPRKVGVPANDVQPDFRSFDNPAVGMSISCSLAQLEDLKSHLALTPAAADQAQQALFFTPFSNKAYDTPQITDSAVFYSAMGTGLRSSQSVRMDAANASVHSRRPQAKILSFADGASGGSRPSSDGAGVALLGPKPDSNAAPETRPEAAAVDGADGITTGLAAIAISDPVMAPEGPLADIQEAPEEVSLGGANVVTPVSAVADASAQPGGSPRLRGADSTASVTPVLDDSPVDRDSLLFSPSSSEAVTVQAPLPAAYLLGGLLEGSGETSGNISTAAPPRANKKLSLGGAAPPAGPSGPRSAGLRREKSMTAAACTPRSGQGPGPARSGATPASAGTVRKTAGASTPAARQRYDVRETPLSSARPLSSAKQSLPRTASKVGTAAAATTTPGRQSSQKPRRPSTVGTDAAREAAAQRAAVERTTPPRSASVTGAAAAAQPVAGSTGQTPVADGDFLAPAMGMGTGTPLFLKRMRPALGTTPPITPFANMKCPAAGARGTGATPPGPAIPVAAHVAPAAAGAPTGKVPVPAQQRVKKTSRPKAPAGVPAKATEPEAKAAQTSKAAVGGRANACGDVAALRRNSSGGGAAKSAAAGSKPAAAHAVPAAGKVSATAAGRMAAAKPTAVGPAAAHKKEATGKQAAGKAHAVEGAAKSHVDTDPGLEGHSEEPQVRLGRASSAGGAAAAGRYSQSAGSDSSAWTSSRQAACHSPDKLPPSKRYAVPITSPSKRPRQERAPSAPPAVPLPLGAPAAGSAAPRAAAAAPAGGRRGRGRSAVRPASSPAMRAALAAKSARSLSANARRPRPSLPGTAAELAQSPVPMQITPSGSARKAGPATAVPSPRPADAEAPLAQVQLVPKLNFDDLAPCKSPMGTPHLRAPSAAMAADVMPLRHHVRSPVLTSCAPSARRLSTTPLPGASPAAGGRSPAAAIGAASATEAIGAAAARLPPAAGAVVQPPNGSLPSARGHAADTVRAARAAAALRTGDISAQGAVVKAKAKNEHITGRTGTAAAAAVGEGGRPLTARPGMGATAAPAAKAPATMRSVSARPGAVHKPVAAAAAATAGAAAAAPKPTAAETNVAGTGADTTKIGKSAAAVAAAAAAAPPQVKPPAVKGSSVQRDAAQHPTSRAPPESHGHVQRQAPRGPAAAAPAARPEPFARGAARQDPEQERAQRRRQYEALLGRSGSGPHTQEAAAASEEAVIAAAPSAAAAKAAANPHGTRAVAPAPSSQPERVAAPKAPGSHHMTQPAHQMVQPRASSRQPTGAHGYLAAQPQRAKAAPAAAKPVAPAAARRPKPPSSVAGSAGAKAANAGGHRGETFSDGAGPSQATPDTAPGLSPQEGLSGMPAAAFSTAAPEETAASDVDATPVVEGLQEPWVGTGTTSDGAHGTSPDADAEEGATPKRPPDLSWLVDASPCASLAITPGAFAAANAFGDDAGGAFGFGELPASGGPTSGMGTAPSPSFNGFGGSAAGDAQPPLVPATCTLGPGSEAAVGAFGACPGDATVVVNMQHLPEAHPMGLPPSGFPSGWLNSGAAPSSTYTNKSFGNGIITPGPLHMKFPGPATNRPKPAGPAPAALPQAKLRFSWDPAATPAAQPGIYACPTPGMADSFMGFGTAAAAHEVTPVSMPNPGGFGAVGMELHGAACGPSDGTGAAGDGENGLDQELPAEVPVPVQCTSPNTPAVDAFGGAVLSGGGGVGAGGADQGLPMFGGAAGGLGRAGRIVQDSFDALRISSMSSWPMMRDRETERV